MNYKFRDCGKGIYQIMPICKEGYVNLNANKAELILMVHEGSVLCGSKPSHMSILEYERLISNSSAFGKDEYLRFRRENPELYNKMIDGISSGAIQIKG